MVLMRCLPVSLCSPFLGTLCLHRAVGETVGQGVSVGHKEDELYPLRYAQVYATLGVGGNATFMPSLHDNITAHLLSSLEMALSKPSISEAVRPAGGGRDGADRASSCPVG